MAMGSIRASFGSGARTLGALVFLGFFATFLAGADIHVDATAPAGGDGLTWGTAFQNVQDALAIALPGDTILVADGVYAPDVGGTSPLGDPTATFTLADGVTIEGDYAGLGAPDPFARDPELYETILDGEIQAIYLAPDGVDTPDCGLSPNSPCDTVAFALSRALALGVKTILVRAGNYPNGLVLDGASGITIQGGFDVNWSFGPYDDPAHLVRIGGGLSDDQYQSVRITNSTGCVLSDLVLDAPNAVGTSGGSPRSSYGVRIAGSTGIHFERVKIEGGNGASGISGTPGTNLSSAANGGSSGGQGQDGTLACNDTSHGAGGSGASSSIDCEGGNGGNGGEQDNECSFPPNYNATYGDTGGSGLRNNSAWTSGGIGGSPCSPGNNGQDGSNGSDGGGGSGAGAGGTVSASAVLILAAGQAGGLGVNGAGGGGGGGSGGCDTTDDCRGAGGGGGGAGGARSPASGTAGLSGGWSIGIILNGSTLALVDCVIEGGTGGAGGTGGGGGQGQSGGFGGSGGGVWDECDEGGDGGDGGRGGHSGAGGGGAGGSVHGVISASSTVTQRGTTFDPGAPGAGGPGGNGLTLIGNGGNGAAGTSSSGLPATSGPIARPAEPLNRVRTVVTSAGIATLDGVTVRGGRDHTGTGAGIQVTGGSLTVRGARIVDHLAATGAGIHLTGGALLLEGSRVRDATATNAAGLHAAAGTTVTIASSLFDHNSATNQAGGIRIAGGIFSANGLTLADNSAGPAGGGFVLTATGTANLANSIVWGNTAAGSPQILVSSGTLTVQSSDVQGSWAGVGNLDADPLFADATNGDYHLAVGSPCIHVGNGGLPDASAFDLDGESRVFCGTVDLGADESPFCPPVDPVTSLTCFLNGGIVQLLWNIGAVYTSIEVTRDGALIATLPGNATSYNDFSPTVGNNSYTVVGIDAGAPSPAAGCAVGIAPAAPSGLLCTLDDTCICAFTLSWTNNSTYDEIQVFAGGTLLVTLPGSDTSAAIELPSAGPQQICVRGAVEAVSSTDVCCSVDCGPPAPFPVSGFSCNFDPGSCTATLSWSLASEYGALRVFVDGALTELLAGTAVGTVVVLPGAGDYDICLGGETICGEAIPEACCEATCGVAFIRGDSNSDALFNIADPVATLAFLFSSAALPCLNASDANDDELLNIADPIYSLAALFSGGPLPSAPHPSCGSDPTVGALSCDDSSCP